MAVIVTDTRTVINEADAQGTWTVGVPVTTIYAEASGCIAVGAYAASQLIYTTETPSISATNHLIYVYAFNSGDQNSWTDTNFGMGLLIGDGTNRVTVKMSGGDKKAFQHSDGPVNWQSLVVDTSQLTTINTAGYLVARAGSLASLNEGALTQFGVDTYSISKALGGGYNQACDIIRWGNDGLNITGGTTSTRGNFLEIVVEDRLTTTLKAHGMIREYSTNLYGIQGPISFGSATGTGWFDDTGITLAYENRFIGDDKYYLKVVGGTGSTNFFLQNSTITTAGPLVTCDFSSNNIDTLTITNNTFNSLGNSITFGTDTAAESHTVTGNVFQGCGQIDAGKVIFENNTISSSTASTTGALLIGTNGSATLDTISFISGGTGHAIYIDTAGDYTLTNFNFSGYGADGTTNAAIYNNSGGTVNLTVLGGGVGLTVLNGTSATTTISNPITLTLTGLITDSEVTILRAGTQTAANSTNGSNHVENSGVSHVYSYNYPPSGYTDVDIFINRPGYVWYPIYNYTLGSSNGSIPIQQRKDNIAP